MIVNLLNKFGADAPTVHIAPETVTTIHGIAISNSMLFAWLFSVVMITVFIIIARRQTMRPKGGFTQFVEIGTDFVTNLIEGSMGDRAKALKYAPYFTTIFFFIAMSNLAGLLPGVGEAFTSHGTPVFRAFTADLNGTLATATISMILVQYFAIRESGPIKHLRHYFSGNLKNPLTYVMGAFELFSEATRLGSLALRLFLNVAIGEIIISIFSFLGKFAAPVTAFPFLFLEIGVGLLQAYIFVMLSITYLAVAVAHSGDHESDDHESAPEIKQIAELA